MTDPNNPLARQLFFDLVARVADGIEGLAHAAARYCVARDYELPDLGSARRALRTQARAAYERVREYAGLVDLGGVLNFVEETLPPDRLASPLSLDWLRALIRFGETGDMADLEDAINRMAERGTRDE